jgi:uncharacterized protein (DUF736 family)
MVEALGTGGIAENRRAMDILGKVDRDLRAEYRARLAELAKPAPKDQPIDQVSAGAPMHVGTRRDKNGREFREYRLEDPTTKRTLAVILEPKDGAGGRVMIVSDGKDFATFSVQYRQEESALVPWDLVADVFMELYGGKMGPGP